MQSVRGKELLHKEAMRDATYPDYRPSLSRILIVRKCGGFPIGSVEYSFRIICLIVTALTMLNFIVFR